ncbi:MAG: hypothetical protein ACK5AZ_06520 [Bryobacteraceae bacterium]
MLLAQDPAAPEVDLESLYRQESWEEVVRRAESTKQRTAQLDYLHGMALAKLKRLASAEEVFLEGMNRHPKDKRFPLELAGVAFLQQDNRQAKQYLRSALSLDPSDAYGNEFLATLYFLDGNLEAALKYWNRVSKPEIESVMFGPDPGVRPDLLQRALVFHGRKTFTVEELRATRANLDRMGVFARYQFELVPRGQQRFDVSFRAIARNTAGSGKLGWLLPMLRGIPYQALHIDYLNARQSAMNFESLHRWDAQKRRVFGAFSSPLGGDPRWRYRLALDGRRETWNVLETYRGTGRAVDDFRMETVEAAVGLERGITPRLAWRNTWSVADRDFRGNPAAEAFRAGRSVKQSTGLVYDLIRMPERRFGVTSVTGAQGGRLFGPQGGFFTKANTVFRGEWLPQPRGDKWVVSGALLGGVAGGALPFDELFILGMERDNDLWLRGRVGTRNGKKGSAPLGTSYALLQFDVDRSVYSNQFFRIQAGPLFDFGRSWDRGRSFGSAGWIPSTGIQTKVRTLAGVTLVMTYARDLAGGRNALYFNAER